ncbi:MAG: hypothetical protein H0X27_07740 [Caulobacteraceae bacterium]|nr:hypothetical protein [Caulobacteraceae bacterium]
MKLLAITIALTLASGGAFAAQCKDKATGRFITCPPPASAAAATTPIKCVKGKRCGGSCIAMSKVCHKPG